MVETFGIGELSRELGATPRAIRFYEDQGLLAPLRRGTRRVYRPRDRVRLQLILRGKRLGFSLAEIRDLIDLYDAPGGEVGQLRILLERIARRRAELERRRADIDATLLELAAVSASCRERLEELGALGCDGARSGDPGAGLGAGKRR